jgi:multidrug transporter EmrE-like cation transporter
MDLVKGILFSLIAQIISFLQLQGQNKYDFIKNNIWFPVLMGIPISFLFILSVRHMVIAYNGEIWPGRLIGFGIGVTVFTTMSHIMFKEPLTLKTIVCLGLALLILLIQMWK